MGRFCHTHVVERTDEELITRKNAICGLVHSGPGLRAELVRIDLELMRRGLDGVIELKPILVK